MNIGEEKEAIEVPIPVDPAKVPKREAIPVPEPVQVPEPARVSMTEREEYMRCGNDGHR